ncbi:TonB-dependent receptor [Candidatus Saganbacteria bacterium]|nr:TonB-dependent receptor [Candidatus Saganbacteria bacterium]
MKKVIRLVLCLCVAMSLCPMVNAIELPSFYSEEIVVTAARMLQLKTSIPWSVSIINSDDLRLKGAKYLSDALNGEIGTDIVNYGGLGALSSVRLRGSSSQQVLILVDGKRVNSPLNGGANLSNYPVDEIEKIEVVRTPLSAVYGADAVGGVVNIITKKPVGGEKAVIVSLGSFNEQKIRLSYNYSDDKWRTYFNAGLNRADGSRANSQFAESDYNVKLSRLLTDITDLELEYSNFSADKRIPGSASSPSPNALQEDRNNILGVSLRSSPDPKSSYLAKIYQRGENSRYKDPNQLTDNPYQAIISGIEIEKRADKLVVGIDARQDAADGSAISGYKAVRNIAIFAENTFGPLSLGLREDLHSTFGSILTPRAGVVKQINQNTSISLAYSGAFRAPVLNELYGNYPAYYAGGLPYLGNPNLKPEKGYLAEISVEYSQQARITVFSGKTSDLITPSWPVNASFTAYSPVNLNSITRQGIELEYKQAITPLLRSVFNYTYQNCVDDSNGDKIVYLPNNKANLSLLIGDSIGGGSFVAKYVGERPYFAYPAPTYAATKALLPDFSTVDLHLFRKIGMAEAYLGVENLFDRSYQLIADYPQPGRRFSFGMKYGF